MLLQIPIFIGVYSAINGLSRSGTGVWAEGFLWLPDLSKADPWYILPFVAAAFQFVQTWMSRPAGQGKVTDPQQAMMNTMMNFMPLSVIFFGLTFASGAVLYWAVQSIYGIIQQWFITGWGKWKDYFPNLPELPEHRRLGYKPPRDLDTFDPSSLPPKKKGPLGRWWSKQMEQAQKISEERRGTGEPEAAAVVASTTVTKATTSKPAQKSERPYSRNSPKGRMLAEQAKREASQPEIVDVEADIVADEVLEADVSTNGTPKRQRRAKK
jgi:YidC/Oxa1 family membrane protein insertase